MIPSTMHFMLDIILDVYGYHVSTLTPRFWKAEDMEASALGAR